MANLFAQQYNTMKKFEKLTTPLEGIKDVFRMASAHTIEDEGKHIRGSMHIQGSPETAVKTQLFRVFCVSVKYFREN